MIKKTLKSYANWLAIGCFFILIFITTTIYSPGFKGGFLFDDIPNLSLLGAYGGVGDWDSFKSFVFGGIAGPTGRPLSLLTFLLNDNFWPSNPSGFKTTNLMIHLLTGCVLCWTTLLLMRLFDKDERQAEWIAVINMGLWLLHPYFVSTTLYVVQRMTQLAALFMLTGMAGYLYGRIQLAIRPRVGYIWMSASIVSGTMLAVLSKENGILLPLLICIVEFCLPSSIRQRNSPDWRWSSLFLWIPSLAVLVMLARYIDFSPYAWPVRPFSQPERLMSEARILWEYLFHLWIPRVEGRGLFQDGYLVSRSLFSPPTTALSIAGLIVLVGMAIVIRRRWPLFSFAILFFFTAHLIESSVVGLELYFEHRNYVAAAFLFLPIAEGLTRLKGYISTPVFLLSTSLLFTLLAGLTLQRALLWGDTGNLKKHWAQSSSTSPRAQLFLAEYFISQGRIQDAERFLEAANKKIPDSSVLTIRLLMQKIATNTANHEDFFIAKEKLKSQRFDAQTLMGLRIVTEALCRAEGNTEYRQWLLDLIFSLDKLEQYRRVDVFTKVSPYLKGMLLIAQRNPDLAIPYLLTAIEYQQDVDAGLAIVAELGSAGYSAEALALLKVAEEMYRKQSTSTFKHSRQVYDSEIERIQKLLLESMEEHT